MNSYEIVDYSMTEEDKKLAEEYDNLTEKIKWLDSLLGISKRKKIKNFNDINELERQINYHIFARNKISDKLYGVKEV